MGFSKQRWEFLKDVYFDQFMIQWTWIVLPKWKQGSGSFIKPVLPGTIFVKFGGFLTALQPGLNQQFVIVFVHKMSKINVKSIYQE